MAVDNMDVNSRRNESLPKPLGKKCSHLLEMKKLQLLFGDIKPLGSRVKVQFYRCTVKYIMQLWSFHGRN